MQTLYQAEATAVGGRNGQVETSDGLLKFELSIPKSMGGPGKPNTTNPEQLFACGYAACFGSAIDHAAKMNQQEIGTIRVTAFVDIGKANQGLELSCELKVHIDDLSKEETEKLIQAAHQMCPYSRATRNNINVKISAI